MPVPTHLKFAVRGVFTGTDEEWSYSLKFQRAVEGQPDAGLDDVDQAAFAARVAAFHNQAIFCSNVEVTEVRGYVMGTDNRMEGDPWLHEFTAPKPSGTGTAWKYPSNVALCVTLEAANRGPARYGRFYLPTVNAGLDASGRLDQANREAFVANVVAYLKDLSDTIDLAGLNSANMLNISAKGVAGASQVVRNVKIGGVLDNISRRRNAMLENYSTSGVIDW